MVMVPGGTSLIISGLDFWYNLPNGSNKEPDLDEFKFQEWRLQELLGVDHFRLPPDYRETWRNSYETPNAGMSIPALRFPAWHFCPSCNLLDKRSSFEQGVRGRVRCPECERKGLRRDMFQVPFVAMCEQGHIQDFPWREWVHRTANPTCDAPLRLVATGSATLGGQSVRCDCKEVAPRSLSAVTSSGERGTFLSLTLDADETEFLCRGKKPWLGENASDACTAHLRGALRNAMNVYYAQIRSSIYLPRATEPVQQELVDMFENPPLSSLINVLASVGLEAAKIAETAQGQHRRRLGSYKLKQIADAVEIVLASAREASDTDKEAEQKTRSFRYAEYDVLRTPHDEVNLKIREERRDQYGPEITTYFDRLLLLDKLKETRAMAGFTRIFPESNRPISELSTMLFRNPPEKRWLPAYVVYGEGIFLELSSSRLAQWEKQPSVSTRIKQLAQPLAILQENKRLGEQEISPRFILLHTLAHLLINQLTFDCGYSSASLRERLYVSSDSHTPMAGVLIYTADGDSEGTMGGLVRMGKPGNIEPVIHKALLGAQWCSADPVCMEIGQSGGQGPDSCNLAACHNCALVPETACEEFNRFLDRALVVGSPDDPSLGFFQLD